MAHSKREKGFPPRRSPGSRSGSLRGSAGGLRRGLDAWLAAASRAVTPTRALLVAALGCAVLLGLSQFADYRGVAVGVDGYDPTISAVAPVPELERAELGSAHGYAMVPVALIAIAILLLALRSGRWRLCRLAALLGAAAIAVGIVVDRPAGLDEGRIARDFLGVEARLLGGFWAQLAAGVGLLVTSLLLGGALRRDAPERARGRAARRDRRGREGRAADGGRDSGSGRRRNRPPRAYPRVEVSGSGPEDRPGPRRPLEPGPERAGA